MNCPYINRFGVCTASPINSGFGAVSPSEEEKQKFCFNIEGMGFCPRLEIFLKHFAMFNKDRMYPMLIQTLILFQTLTR